MIALLLKHKSFFFRLFIIFNCVVITFLFITEKLFLSVWASFIHFHFLNYYFYCAFIFFHSQYYNFNFELSFWMLRQEQSIKSLFLNYESLETLSYSLDQRLDQFFSHNHILEYHLYFDYQISLSFDFFKF